MFDTLMKLDKDRATLDFYATDKRAIEELLNREKFRKTVFLWNVFSALLFSSVICITPFLAIKKAIRLLLFQSL